MPRLAHFPRLRPWLLRALWLLLVLLLLEGTTRAFFRLSGHDIDVWRHFTPTRLPRLMVTDPVLGWRLLPGVARNVLTSEFQLIYRTNRHGLREVEVEPDGRARLLFLGDSQTFGEGVEVGRRFSDLVGQRLGVFSINAGVPGWGLHQMVDWFVLDGHGLRPDFVVCAPIEGDLARALFPVGGASGPPQLVVDPDEHEFVPARLRPAFAKADRVLRHSYLYAFFGAQAKIALLRRRLEARDRRVWAQVYAKGERGERQGKTPPRAGPEGAEGGVPVRGLERAADVSDPREALMRATSARLLLRLRDSVTLSGAQFVLAPIDDHPLPWLERFAADNGIAYVDASPALRGQTGVRHRIDPHYTAKGHALLADALAAGLRARLDLARRSPGPNDDARRRLLAEAARLRAGTPRELEAEGYRAGWTALDVPGELERGQRREVQVRVRNVSPATWPAGRGQVGMVRLGHRWRDASGRVTDDYGDRRADLPAALAPGAQADLRVTVEAPDAAGAYVLEFDLVCEGQAWFGPRGSETLALPVRVR